MLLIDNNVNEKTSQKSRQTKFSKHSTLAICNLHSCYNFALVLHENALVLCQSEARNLFFMHFTSVVCTIVVIAKTTEMSKNTSFQNTARPVKQFLELAALFLEPLRRFRYKFSNSCVTLYWKIFHKSCWTLSDINTNKPSKVKYVQSFLSTLQTC